MPLNAVSNLSKLIETGAFIPPYRAEEDAFVDLFRIVEKTTEIGVYGVKLGAEKDQ